MASARFYTGVAVLAVLLAAISVLGSMEKPSAALPPKPDVDLIAIVDEARRILTIEPDGSETRLLTPVSGAEPQLYTWPTWSPDARSMVITRVVGSSGPPAVSLERVDLDTGDIARRSTRASCGRWPSASSTTRCGRRMEAALRS